MAMFGVKVPEEIAKKLSKIKVPGEKLELEEFHSTIFYFKDMKIEDAVKAISVIFEVLKRQPKFTMKLDKAECFPENEDGVPIICPVESTELHKFHKKLAKKLDEAEVNYSKRWPEYKPHVTLSYAKESIEEKEFSPLEWDVEELYLWAGSDMREGMCVKFDLKRMKKAADLLALFTDLYVKAI